MKIIKSIDDKRCKISIFEWNHKYIVKFEHDSLEQVFKISKWDIRDENELRKMIDDDFINNTMKRFSEMKNNLNDTTLKYCG